MNFDLQTKIAFLGMGLMGSRMATRLLQAGFAVAVWNRSPSACDALIEQGATALDLSQLGQYPAILTCLADDHAVQNVFSLIRPHLSKGQIIADFSSLSVECTKQLAQEAQQQGVNWIDCPVSGGTAGAELGTLVIFAGGDAPSIQRLELIYNVLSQRVTRMGETGAGQATKICNQLIVAANSTLIAEAVALAEHAGVDTTLLAPALAGGFADSKPFQILTPRMASQSFEPVQWKVQTLSKDLNNALKLAASYQLHVPVATQALDQLQQHQANGYAEADLSTIRLQVKSN
ncbi:NAD(P)-dependent oxidoreductase [Acinetobacter cumulans]|jgi:3-hydroxyisobutyrate dehydrogenase|uniref:NAD(P)-dependent oxidoreductase n=1 Tax=Acinetobacter cumulans TaxID=2136182 RepID=A0A3A8GGS1_9GAMM|nr:NAD(P)-dependent oxidoreductase [Acinetobacter cumulans]RKG52981.1 NAD(P)-dependent oxidoreductase [Acinetobacter cumulans]